MLRYFKNYVQALSRLVTIAFAFNVMLLPQLSVSAPVTSPLDLATIPLANSPTITIEPNLLFILDDSGSMSWNYMPDWADDDSPPDSLYKNASYNTIAYNPSIRYSPPVFFNASGLNTTQYPSQVGQAAATGANTATKPNWRQVKNNAYTGTDYPTGTSNLENEPAYYHVIPGEYCTRPDLRVCVAQSSATATYPYPAPVRWCRNSTNANATTPAANTCQASRVQTGTTTYNSLRMPTQRTATITINNSNDCSSGGSVVNGVLVDTKQIMANSATCSTNEDTTAINIATQINNCTYTKTGNCTVVGYRATRSNNVLTVFAPTAFTGTPSVPTSNRTITTARTAFTKNNVSGEMHFVPLTSTVTSYTLPGSVAKATDRADCTGATCTYVEEMTNYANWHTYYGTRGQAMKTSASIAFKDVTEDFRLGFMTTSTRAAQMLNFDIFNPAQKAAWYSKLFAAPADRNTPLRGALSKAGRIYANEPAAKRGVFTDPMQYECQQNFSLLTTDGYWNTNDENSTYAGGPLGLDGTNVGNMDSAEKNTPRPMREGTTAVDNTLADVAKYYFDTDIRTGDLKNCTGAKGTDICQSPNSTANKKQNMVTLTLGLGVDGLLSYTSDYKIATTGDFVDIENNSKQWPDPIANSGPERIDDLWHAAVNGGGTYFSAKNPTDLVKQLKEALASIEVKLGAGSAAATSTLNPVADDADVYVASYTSGYWTGNLEKRLIDTDTGAVGVKAFACVEDIVTSTSCVTPSSVLADGSGGYNCVTPDVTDAAACSGDLVGTDCKVSLPVPCNGKLKQQVQDNSRTIYMNSGGTLTSFTIGAIASAGLDDTFGSTFLATNLTQWISFTPEQLANFTSERLVSYLRGQTTYDESAADPRNKLFRKRQAVLGDAVDSKPAFVGKPTFKYSDAGYSAFKTAQAGRKKTVYMGANDGMLHAFDAIDLKERWAYVPSMVIPNMWKLADTAYGNKHTYYVNGDPIVSDVYDGSAWRTILVAGLNGGGRGYYGLDITDPDAPKLLWEFDANDQPNLGYSFGTPIVTKRSDGTWVVIVTSGYNNIPDNSEFYKDPDTKFKPNNPALFNGGDGMGYLYVLNAISGAELSAIPTGVGSTSLPSGLAEISAYADDPEKNNTATYVYGGDLLGNLWRFNLTDNSKLLFAKLEAGSTQAITTSPELGTIKNKRVVFVGTGKYLEVSDLNDTSQQTLYAIKDDNVSSTITNPRSVLVEQTIKEASDGLTRESTSTNSVDFSSGLGWYIDFPDNGERQNVASQLVLGTLLVPTTVPKSSACQPAGYGWLTFLDYKTGTAVSNYGSDVVSFRTNAPTVGFNVVYIKGDPKVSIVTADNPTPQPLDVPFTGSGDGFQKHRSIWRELNL